MRAFFLNEAQMETGVKGLMLDDRLRLRGSESPKGKIAEGAEIRLSKNLDLRLNLGTETGDICESSNNLIALTSLVGGEGEFTGSDAGRGLVWN